MDSNVLRLVEKVVGPLTKDNAIQWLRSIAIALILAFGIIRPFILEPFKIPSGSMEKTLLIGDKILVIKFLFGLRIPFTFKKVLIFRKPARGDVVVFRWPEDANRDIVKRVVGLPGERIKISDDGKILVNGDPITGPSFIANNPYSNSRGYGTFGTIHEVTVPEDSYFVLGDNSRQSKDGRAMGFVPLSHIKGKAVCVWWPMWRMRGIAK